jgi:hypothetical protein
MRLRVHHEGKQAFASYEEAERIAKRSRRRKYRQRQNVYRCPHCRQWHIGTQPKGF